MTDLLLDQRRRRRSILNESVTRRHRLRFVAGVTMGTLGATPASIAAKNYSLNEIRQLPNILQKEMNILSRFANSTKITGPTGETSSSLFKNNFDKFWIKEKNKNENKFIIFNHRQGRRFQLKIIKTTLNKFNNQQLINHHSTTTTNHHHHHSTTTTTNHHIRGRSENNNKTKLVEEENFLTVSTDEEDIKIIKNLFNKNNYWQITSPVQFKLILENQFQKIPIATLIDRGDPTTITRPPLNLIAKKSSSTSSLASRRNLQRPLSKLRPKSLGAMPTETKEAEDSAVLMSSVSQTVGVVSELLETARNRMVTAMLSATNEDEKKIAENEMKLRQETLTNLETAYSAWLFQFLQNNKIQEFEAFAAILEECINYTRNRIIPGNKFGVSQIKMCEEYFRDYLELKI